ncbi:MULTISPECIES: hypothetical protein [Gordonia]|uniref:hypothetical protein n=1 Tax=Gordonia TaxID=2053 RepID=UPI0002A63B79|nr:MULTISPECIES: hypothetical protein [Gordonia]KAF0967003.1 hypothetical protein BPODLACK_04522 [Gordonia sp. YY1]MCZ4651931.1 hypothetical protein [Gordonia amicalis]MDV7099019.1 hypothetical protein [Gordonia amicalis]NKX76465.1 hypothetical protein [Gordonia amicalis]GAC51461.1 hypothetical protein GOAMI_01_01670 [Gordonia amicalis NBRC 100051 = JCM 11271]
MDVSSRTDELAGLRRRMAAMSGRPDRHAVETRDPAAGVLPIPEPLSEILPHNGIPRGTVARFDGANSLLVAMIASVARAGGQVGIVGMPRLSLLSAVEMGADLSRIATIPDPGIDPVEVAAVLLDGMDLVVLGKVGPGVGAADAVAPSRARVVMGRVRKQSSVLLVAGGTWPGAQLTIEARVLTYRHSPLVPGATDLDSARSGYGRIGGMRLQVTASGRGRQSQSTEVDLLARGQGAGRTVEMVSTTSARPVLAVAN